MPAGRREFPNRSWGFACIRTEFGQVSIVLEPAAKEVSIEVPAGAFCQPAMQNLYGVRSRPKCPANRARLLWALWMRLLDEGKIRPVIGHRFPLLEAARANALLEGGQVVDGLVLVAPDPVR